MVTVNTGTTELDFGVEVISRQSPSLFLLHTLIYSISSLYTGPTRDPRTASLVQDFQIFVGPGPGRDSEIVLGPGPVPGFEFFLGPGPRSPGPWIPGSHLRNTALFTRPVLTQNF